MLCLYIMLLSFSMLFVLVDLPVESEFCFFLSRNFISMVAEG